jgi:hypothetical protein
MEMMKTGVFEGARSSAVHPAMSRTARTSDVARIDGAMVDTRCAVVNQKKAPALRRGLMENDEVGLRTADRG